MNPAEIFWIIDVKTEQNQPPKYGKMSKDTVKRLYEKMKAAKAKEKEFE